MGIPHKISDPDFGLRTHSAYDLELTLVKFLQQLFVDSYRLDNPTVNLAQPAVVPFDYKERAQTLTLKVPPRIERGRVPRTLTGEIAVDRLPDCPAIIVQFTGAHIRTEDSHNQKRATVKIWLSAYDENPDGSGYQDVLNMAEALEIALVQFRVLDQAYPLEMPVEWHLIEADTFPHFMVEMETKWQLPAARSLPDAEIFGIIPAEYIELRATASRQYPLYFMEEPNGGRPDEPPGNPPNWPPDGPPNGIGPP